MEGANLAQGLLRSAGEVNNPSLRSLSGVR